MPLSSKRMRAFFEAELFEIGLAAGGDQKMRPVDLRVLEIRDVERHAHAGPPALVTTRAISRLRGCRCLRLAASRGAARTSSGSSLASALSASSTVTSRAEPAEGLRHLEADRPAADDDEMRRQTLQLEDRLVGEIGNGREILGSAGAVGREPVATTKRRARISVSPTVMACRSLEARLAAKHGHAETGETARPKSFGSIAAITCRTCAMTAAKFTRGSLALTPKRLGRRGPPQPAAPRRSAPSTARSRCSGSRRPSCPSRQARRRRRSAAAAAATVSPAEPAPMTQMSGVRTSLMPPVSPTLRPPCPCRAAIFCTSDRQRAPTDRASPAQQKAPAARRRPRRPEPCRAPARNTRTRTSPAGCRSRSPRHRGEAACRKSAAARFTSQNGNTGTRRRKSR